MPTLVFLVLANWEVLPTAAAEEGLEEDAVYVLRVVVTLLNTVHAMCETESATTLRKQRERILQVYVT